MENCKDVKENTNVGGCIEKTEVSDKNIIVDCIHMSFDKDMEEQDGSSDEDVLVVNEEYESHVQIHNEGLLPKIFNWPDNVELYQPFESGQIFFPEMPSCLYVQAFLRMCNLEYTLVQKSNTESIGPSGEVPVLRCGIFIVSGAENIIKFVEAKGIVTSDLTKSQKIEISFYTSLVRMTLANAEDFITWLDPETYSKITKSRFCSVHPWPLSLYLLKQKRQKIQNKLNAMGWESKTFEDACEDISMCFKALSDKIEGNYFFGNQPTHIDALIFAHTYTIMSISLPKSQFSGIILGYPKIVKHCHRVINSYFNELNTSNQFAELENNFSS